AALSTTLNGTVTTAPITVAAGSTGNTLTITSAAAGTSTFAGVLNLNNNLTVDNTASTRVITFSGGLIEGGTVPLTISKSNNQGAVNFTGLTTVSGADLTIAYNFSAATPGTTPLFTFSGGFSGGSVANNADLALKNNTSIAGGIVLSGSSVNNLGSMPNSGTGHGSVTVSAAT